MAKINRAACVILILIIAGLTGTIIYLNVTVPETNRFTEFYLLNQEGRASDYPCEMVAGVPSTVILGIINHEARPAVYTIQVMANDDIINTVTTGTLADKQKWEREIDINMNSAGDNQSIKFFLYIDEAATPHIKDPLILNTNVIISE